MYGDPNDVAVLISLSLPLCLALALTTAVVWKKLVWAMIMLAMIYAVFLTASRAGAIALALAALMCAWKLGVESRRRSLIVLIPVALLVFWLYAGNLLGVRFEQGYTNPSTRNQGSEAYDSSQGRLQLLIQSLNVTAQHPLLGVGPGNFEIVSGMWHVTHNTFTQMSAEGGVPAFLLYVLIFWRALSNLRAINKTAKTTTGVRLISMALEASLAAYLVGSFFLTHGYQLFPYCLVAYTSVLLLIARRYRLASSQAERLNVTPAPVEAKATVWQ